MKRTYVCIRNYFCISLHLNSIFVKYFKILFQKSTVCTNIGIGICTYIIPMKHNLQYNYIVYYVFLKATI